MVILIISLLVTVHVYAAGVCSAVGVAALGIYGLMAILYMTIQCSPHSTLRRHKVTILITKLILSLVAGKRERRRMIKLFDTYDSHYLFPALTGWTSVGLFAVQGDDLEHGYIITVGVSFYLEVSAYVKGFMSKSRAHFLRKMIPLLALRR